jgi:putative Ca2+/H+ antiporter (TMEM165/GDT1 family)
LLLAAFCNFWIQPPLTSPFDSDVTLSDNSASTPPAPEPAIESLDRPANPDARLDRSRAIGAFGSTFVAIFLAEFGDKTQIAVLLMAAESHQPWVVFAGAAAALIATSLVGVVLGQWLAQRLSARTLETVVGALLLVVSASLLWDVMLGS